MKIIKNHKFSVFQAMVIILIALLLGCKPAPIKSNVRNLILKDFESRRYKVVKLKISHIRPISSGEKVYMGSASYVVDISSLTLEVIQDIESPMMYKKGQQLTFKDAHIEIREDLYQKGRWVITNIKGITVP